MIRIKKIFYGEGSGMDGDNSPKSIAPNGYLNLQNGRVGVSENGRNARVENVAGTTAITNNVYPPYGVSQTIGSTTDTARDRIIYANWNSWSDSGIYCYDKPTGNTYAILYDSQVVGGLNFSKDNRIDRNMDVVGDMLYFTDGTENGQRKVNIEAGIKSNHASYVTDVAPYNFPLSFDEITLIVPPCALAPKIVKNTDGTFSNNFIANDSFSFAHQFIYRDNEESVVGTYSRASRLNKPDDTYNRILVTMDTLQQIPDNVQIVNLVVRNGNTAAIVKTWDRAIQSERNEILEHNAGTATLTYNFYNNVTGQFISSDKILKPFDSVPRSSKTQEVAKNRLNLANNLEGYNVPTVTSLASTVIQTPISVTNLNKNLIAIFIGWKNPNHSYSAWYVYLTEVVPIGYYAITTTETFDPSNFNTPALPTPPTSVAFGGLTFRGENQTALNYNLNTAGGNMGGRIDIQGNSQTLNPIEITGLTVPVFDVFKSRANYKMGTAFYDFAMRKCSVVVSEDAEVTIPARDFDYTTGATAIGWTLSNTNALLEIPDWAYYYAPLRTLNLRTRFFIQGFDSAAKYVTKNVAGEYLFTQTTFVTGTVAIGLDTTGLVQGGLGYTFNEGDVCYLIEEDGTPHELPVIGQSGKYILIKPVDIGDLVSNDLSYEIYTPYATSEQEPFYEVGSIYKITDPTLSTRVYSVLADVMIPDAYVIQRSYLGNSYFSEAMSPNDVFYRRWDNDAGKVNFVSKLGEQYKTNFGRFSNTYISGTAINGLSTFEALNDFFVPIEMGEINKLQLADKVTDDGQGNILLVICEARTASIYLNEAQLQASSKSLAVVKTEGYIGTINILKGAFGTTAPETVIEYGGLVFFYDLNSGTIVQYSPNGLDPVSDYKMSRYFQMYAKDYLAASSGNLNNINGFSHIPTAINPYGKEFMVTCPALIYENYASNLPSYSSVPSYATSIINRFDIYDQLGKTLSLSILKNQWGSNFEFMAEHYEYLSNQMYGFKDGLLYVFNSDSVNTNKFFGVNYPLRLCFVVNEIPSAIMDIFNVAIEGSVAPDFTVGYSNNPNLQITDLQGSDYENVEGAMDAKFFRDRISPNNSGTADQKLFTGDTIIANPFFVMLEFQCYDGLMYVDAANIGLDISRGQKQLITK